ncbi:isoprenylcysteine carboxylmethyltransferase family protein [Candidatus Microgenomates bacterium]|nr:isoprenylcysteine carboxylmethyltransferase family protein [Candidatus Microgenomates bacterium]
MTLKSLLFAISVVALILLFFSQIIKRVDKIFGFGDFQSSITIIVGIILIATGGILRFWSALLFYRHKIKVISVHSQKKLITAGTYRCSRNPLYLGIIFIFFGAAILFGSISGLILSFLVFIGWDLWVRFREEKQLEEQFKEDYLRYKKVTQRWL